MLVPATKITDSEKKNELILFANSIGAKATFVESLGGMAINCNNQKQEKEVKKKIKELTDNSHI